MALARTGALMLSVALLLGCGRRHSEVASCASPSTCACRALSRADSLKARVVAIDGASVELLVEEVFTPASLAKSAPGAKITGAFGLGPDACTQGRREAPTAGSTVFAAHESERSRLWLVPWTDPLDLVDRKLPLSSLGAFADYRSCDADLPLMPCADSPDPSRCALSRTNPAPPAWLALAALVPCGLVLRRKKMTQLRA